MNRSFFLGVILGSIVTASVASRYELPMGFAAVESVPNEPPRVVRTETRVYENSLAPIENAKPLLADFPQYVEPIEETRRFEAPRLVDDPGADLDVRAWRWSYNSRGIIEMPNRLRSRETAVIVVHPWAIDDGWGWKTPEPNGVADFCTPEKNRFAARHTKDAIDPFLKRLRNKVAFVMYSLPGPADAIRKKVYRSFAKTPRVDERAEGEKELRKALAAFSYKGEPLPAKLTLSADRPVIDYFR